MGNIILSNGISMPDLCLGTGITGGIKLTASNIMTQDTLRAIKYNIASITIYRGRSKMDRALAKVVKSAMNNGCHMFDTSRAYGSSEWRLGEALKKYNRGDYFICTKINNYSQYNDCVEECLRESLRELEIDYVDLCLLHWPVPNLYINSWNKLEKLYNAGLCKAIGVSNFNIHHLEIVSKDCSIKPMVNEIECHPLFTQEELRNYCNKNDIRVLAYTSTARGDGRLKYTCIPRLATKYKKNDIQIILRWHQQIGNVPIVYSSNPIHFAENTNISDFTMTHYEIEEISAININSRLRFDPDNCDYTKL